MGSERKNTYTDLFSRLGNKPESISDNDLDIIERFVVELYIPSVQNTSSYSLASVRLKKFVRSSNSDLRELPPSREALRKQAKCSCFQSVYLWVRAVEDIPLPDTSLRGCIFNENKEVFVPLWKSGTCSITIGKFTSTFSWYKRNGKFLFKLNIKLKAVTRFFYNQRFFSTQPQCCLFFS